MVKSFFISTLVLVLLFSVSISYSFAHEETDGTDSAKIAENKEEPVYVLVYPGMLPDNPLYFLKSFRDSFVGFMISDPLKKAEFDLLQSDKMISSAAFLVRNGNKQDLAVETVERGQAYFADAIVKTNEAEEQGVNMDSFLVKLESAAQKHAEVLEELYGETKNKSFHELSEESLNSAEEVHSLQH